MITSNVIIKTTMAGLELLSDQGFRLDGRKPHELRKISCRMSVFGQSEGSAYMEQGNTKVLATVYGPHEVRAGSGQKALHDRVVINCQYSTATFSTIERKRRPRGDRKSLEMEEHLRQTFAAAIKTELYPRSQIDIFVQILQSDGGDFAACVNAATLAVLDAGIPVKDYVCACSSGFVDDKALVDVSYVEGSSGGPELCVAFLPRSEEIVLLEMTSRVHVDNLEKMLKAATNGCKDTYAILDRTVREHVGQLGVSLGL